MIRTHLCAAALALVAVAASGQADTPEAAFAAADTERAQLDVFRDFYKGSDPDRLAEVITAFGEASRRLDDGGGSRAVAKALARGLKEDELSPRNASVVALSYGRDPDTVLPLLEDLLGEARTEIQKRLTRPDPESRAERNAWSELYSITCRALAYHADDRAVDALADEMRRVRPGGQNNNLPAILIPPLTDALTSLGQREGIELIVRTTSNFVGANQKGNAKRLHSALAGFSDGLGWAPPTFDDKYDQSWRDWFDEHEDELPDSLGKLEEPIERPAGLNGRRRMNTPDPNAPRRP